MLILEQIPGLVLTPLVSKTLLFFSLVTLVLLDTEITE